MKVSTEVMAVATVSTLARPSAAGPAAVAVGGGAGNAERLEACGEAGGVVRALEARAQQRGAGPDVPPAQRAHAAANARSCGRGEVGLQVDERRHIDREGVADTSPPRNGRRRPTHHRPRSHRRAA